MKTNAIIRIIVFSLAILILASVLIGVLAFDMYIFDGKVQFDHIDTPVDSLEQIKQENITADIRNIEIEWVAGSITPTQRKLRSMSFHPLIQSTKWL